MASPVLTTELRNLTWVPVSSSNVAAIAYTGPDFQRLWVSFHNGSVYVYDNVEPAVYEGLASAGSKGGYLARTIKGRYGYRRVV